MTEQDILDDVLECSACGNLGKELKWNTDSSVKRIDWLMENLPGIEYVQERMVNYIFSNGLTSEKGSDEENETLQNWLYNVTNAQNQSNYIVLQEAIGYALCYGCAGLRLFDNALYCYKKGTYGSLVSKHDGIKEIVAYFVREDGKDIDEEFDLKDITNYMSVEQFFNERNLILLDKSEFSNIANDPSEIYGMSPLLRDKYRVNLLLSAYDRLNYDIVYDGPGRIILRPKDGFADTDTEVSTTTVLSNSPQAKAERIEKAKQEVKRVAKEIKDSSSDSIVLLSNAFDKDIEKLPRVTKATEFFDWVSNEGVILSQLLGMSPTLLEVGQIHGNVSVEKIIDNAMLNTIIPRREQYAIQFSPMISTHLGIPKVYFNKYDLQQVQDENEVRLKVSQIVQKLASAQKAAPNDTVMAAITLFAEYLQNSIVDDSGQVKSM